MRRRRAWRHCGQRPVPSHSSTTRTRAAPFQGLCSMGQHIKNISSVSVVLHLTPLCPPQFKKWTLDALQTIPLCFFFSAVSTAIASQTHYLTLILLQFTFNNTILNCFYLCVCLCVYLCNFRLILHLLVQIRHWTNTIIHTLCVIYLSFSF